MASKIEDLPKYQHETDGRLAMIEEAIREIAVIVAKRVGPTHETLGGSVQRLQSLAGAMRDDR